jgi:hypothetical protein
MTVNSANLPFTREQFLAMFEAYNQAIWPAHVIAYLLGIAAVGLIVWRVRASDRLISAVLTVFWLWLGAVFLLTAMRTIDTGPGPLVFGAAFLAQAGLWVVAGMLRTDLRFERKLTAVSIIGALVIAYALLI